MIFSSIFLHAVTFSHVLHLDVLRRQIESENWNFLMYGYNAEPPIAIPICDSALCTWLFMCVCVMYHGQEVYVRYRPVCGDIYGDISWLP